MSRSVNTKPRFEGSEDTAEEHLVVVETVCVCCGLTQRVEEEQMQVGAVSRAPLPCGCGLHRQSPSDV